MSGIDTSVKQIALAQPQRPLTGFLGSVAGFLRDFKHTVFDTYRPEAHYMRGPGPACAAKRPRTQGSSLNSARIVQVFPSPTGFR